MTEEVLIRDSSRFPDSLLRSELARRVDYKKELDELSQSVDESKKKVAEAIKVLRDELFGDEVNMMLDALGKAQSKAYQRYHDLLFPRVK